MNVNMLCAMILRGIKPFIYFITLQMFLRRAMLSRPSIVRMYRMVGRHKDQLGSQNLTYFHVNYYKWGHIFKVFCVQFVDFLMLILSCMDKTGYWWLLAFRLWSLSSLSSSVLPECDRFTFVYCHLKSGTAVIYKLYFLKKICQSWKIFKIQKKDQLWRFITHM